MLKKENKVSKEEIVKLSLDHSVPFKKKMNLHYKLINQTKFKKFTKMILKILKLCKINLKKSSTT